MENQITPMPSHASASLYVGSLAPDVSEATLFEVFSKVGPVASIRVCRDAVTRRSLGYAYINFFQMQDAERALDALNYTNIKGRSCRIMWVQRDPSLRKSGVGNIFIKNLDKNIDNRQLHDTFSAFGNILSCKVVTDENGLSRGYGFVHFETAEAAEKAINRVNGMLISEKKVYVTHHIPKRERESKAEELKRNFTNVYIKNLDESVDEKQLYQLFSKYGEITSHVVARDENTHRSKGFAFVNFKEHTAAVKAVTELNENEIGGKKLYVSRAQKKSERQEELRRKHEASRLERLNKYQGVNLYVKNLDDTIDSERLRQEFSTFGTITSHKIVTDEKGNSKGFGFVCFSAPEEATKAVTEMNGRMIGSKPIYVALAQRKDIRRQQLVAQHQQRMLAHQTGGMMAPSMYGTPPVFYSNAVGMQPPRGQPGYFPMIRPPRWATPAQQSGRPSFSPIAGTVYMRPAGGRRQGGAPRSGQPAGVAGPQTLQPSSQPAPARPIQQTGAPVASQRRPANTSYQFKSNVRNPRPEGPGGLVNAGQSALADGAQDILTLERLSGLDEASQKNLIGERIFTQIMPQCGENTGKITGMLLAALETADLLHLLESQQQLTEKVQEALNVLLGKTENEEKK